MESCCWLDNHITIVPWARPLTPTAPGLLDPCIKLFINPNSCLVISSSGPYIKTEPLDGSLCGQSSYTASQAHDYYHNPFSLINVESYLGATVPNCQPWHSNLPGPEPGPQQPNPPVALSPGSQSSGLYHQLGIVVPEVHHPMRVHAMPPVLSTCINPTSSIQLLHPGQMLPASQAEHKVVYTNNCPQATVMASAALPEACPPVIQPQPYSQPLPKSRPLPEQKFPQPEDKKAAASGNINIKQENLDQAYLDDGEQALHFAFCPFSVFSLKNNRLHKRRYQLADLSKTSS